MEKRNVKIEITKFDTYALGVRFKGIKEDLTKAYFTIKENIGDEPLLQKTLNAGISKIEDKPYKEEKVYKVQIQSEDTANLEIDVQYLYDLQVSINNVVKTVLSGFFVVKQSVAGNPLLNSGDIEVYCNDIIEAEMITTPVATGIEYENDPVAKLLIGDLAKLETTNKESVVNAVNEMSNKVENEIEKIKNGTTIVGKAKNAENAEFIDGVPPFRYEDGVLKVDDIIIPQKKLLSKIDITTTNETTGDLIYNGDLRDKTIEINANGIFYKFKGGNAKYWLNYLNGITEMQYITFTTYENSLSEVNLRLKITNLNNMVFSNIKVAIEIYEIIE